MRASDLTSPKLTRVEKENCQAMAIYKQYKQHLENAKKHKIEYLEAKEMQKKDIIVKMLKEFAIESWEKSQHYLAEYNEFEKNRKYPNY